jgi:general secretion pathway protein K
MRKGNRLPAAQRGIALIIALWITILLTVIASGFAFSMRGEALAARNAISLAQARSAADGAIERTAFELTRPRIPDAWTPDGQPHRWQDGDASIVVTAVDEAAKIDLNMAPEPLLRNLMIVVGGVDDSTAAHIVDAIGDWKDPDDLKRPNGAEEADYRAAGLKYCPANAQFETVGELARVLGVTPDVYARLAPALTVYSRQPGVNPATASRTVLLALPNATPEAVDAFIEQRTAALAAKQPIPPFPPAQAFPSGPVPVWRIHAEATWVDGVTFAREAVLRPSGDPQRPLITLAWLESPRAPAVVAAAPGEATPAADSRATGLGGFLSNLIPTVPGSNARRP